MKKESFAMASKNFHGYSRARANIALRLFDFFVVEATAEISRRFAASVIPAENRALILF